MTKPVLAALGRGAAIALAGMALLGSITTGATATAQEPTVSTMPVKAVTSTDAGVTDICNYTTSRPTLRRGSTGAAVRQAQCYLYYSVRDADLEIDGDFGPITEYWVRRFQTCDGLKVDGVVGTQTWLRLKQWANSSEFVC